MAWRRGNADTPATAPIDWETLLDGRLRRFKRGVDYDRPSELVQRDAKAAAEDLGKMAASFKDVLGKREYLWVQFLDGEVDVGQPCPKCGGTSLDREQWYFARCQSCHSLLELSQPTWLGGPDPSEVGELVGIRLLSPEGEEISEMSVLGEAVLEASAQFFQAVPKADAHFQFFVDGKKALRTACPDSIGVSVPQVVRFRLHIGPRVLHVAEYAVTAAIHATLDENGDRSVRLDKPDPFTFRVFDPHAREGRPEGEEIPGPNLHWTVGLDDEPAPLPSPDGR